MSPGVLQRDVVDDDVPEHPESSTAGSHAKRAVSDNGSGCPFINMDDDCRKLEVRRRLVAVHRLPKTRGTPVYVTRMNGGADALREPGEGEERIPA